MEPDRSDIGVAQRVESSGIVIVDDVVLGRNIFTLANPGKDFRSDLSNVNYAGCSVKIKPAFPG